MRACWGGGAQRKMAGVLCRVLLSHEMVSHRLEMSIAGTVSPAQLFMWVLGGSELRLSGLHYEGSWLLSHLPHPTNLFLSLFHYTVNTHLFVLQMRNWQIRSLKSLLCPL